MLLSQYLLFGDISLKYVRYPLAEESLFLYLTGVQGNPVELCEGTHRPGTLPWTFLILLCPRFAQIHIKSLLLFFLSSWVWSKGKGAFTNIHARPYNNPSWLQDLDFLTLISYNFTTYLFCKAMSVESRITTIGKEHNTNNRTWTKATKAHRLFHDGISPQKQFLSK